jgi:hypothetical protein
MMYGGANTEDVLTGKLVLNSLRRWPTQNEIANNEASNMSEAEESRRRAKD